MEFEKCEHSYVKLLKHTIVNYTLGSTYDKRNNS